ncbi:MAG: BON domain-containing protein [Desulfobacteraceae bacterium]|nr:MAG: BON domain-containing protein [Desulfobacteraceae bacterium]
MPLITISRSIGSGGGVIAAKVAEALKVELYDDLKLQHTAIDMGIPLEDLKSLDEKAPWFFDRLLSRKPESYLSIMESVVYKVAQEGQGVILGHGSQWLLRVFDCAFHVYIHSTGSSRIRYIMETKGMSREAAEKLVAKTDNEQSGFFRYAFHMDWNDPSLYDLIINTEKLGIEAAAKLIVDTAGSEALSECSLTAVGGMERLSLKKRVEAAILETDINPYLFSIEVPEKGVVHLNGTTYSEEEKNKLIRVVRQVSGVSNVKVEIGIMPAGV